MQLCRPQSHGCNPRSPQHRPRVALRPLLTAGKDGNYAPDVVKVPVGSFFALVDESDAERVLKHRWHALVRKNTTYAQTHIGGHTVFMHRFILELPPRVGIIDHRDRNGLNNQRLNLRVGTHSENMLNTDRHLKPQATCGKGHPLDGTRLRLQGGRYCKTCNRLNKQRQRAAGKRN